MKYATLFELSITHPYYRDGLCPDFTLVPSAETASLLRRVCCRFMPLPYGGRVVAALDADAARLLVSLEGGASLRFHLALQNDDFALFTDLSGLAMVPLFTNADLPAGQGGELSLLSRTGARLPQGMFAAVEILLAVAVPVPVAPRFRVAFQARAARWAYYCLTDLPAPSSAADGQELTITDAQPAGSAAVVFSAANRASLDEAAAAADPVARQQLALHPGMRCVRFLSDGAVVCCEEPRKYLELRRGAERLLAPLPNPSIRSFARMPPPHAAQDLLFQVLRYRTRPFV